MKKILLAAGITLLVMFIALVGYTASRTDKEAVVKYRMARLAMLDDVEQGTAMLKDIVKTHPDSKVAELALIELEDTQRRARLFGSFIQSRGNRSVGKEKHGGCYQKRQKGSMSQVNKASGGVALSEHKEAIQKADPVKMQKILDEEIIWDDDEEAVSKKEVSNK